MAVRTPLEIVKRECNIPLSSSTYDATLDFYTGVAEEVVASRYNFSFGTISYSGETFFGIFSNELLQLKHAPLVSVQEVRVWDYPDMTGQVQLGGPASGQSLIQPQQFRIIDFDGSMLQFLVTSPFVPPGLTNPISSDNFMWSEVQVSYTAGLTVIPQSTFLGIAWLVAHWMSSQGYPKEVKEIHTGDYRAVMWDMTAWPVPVLEILGLNDRSIRVGVI